MRRLLFASAVALLASPAFAETITVKIDGVVCAFCAKGIEQLFGDEAAVKSVHVDVDTGAAHIVTNGDATLSDARVKELVSESGYDATSITRAP